MVQFITPAEAAAKIPDGSTIYMTGMGLGCFAEEVAIGIQDAFLAGGHPRDLTLYHSTGIGNSKDRGMHYFAHEGLLKRLVGGHFGVGGPALMDLIHRRKVEAYNLPQGVLVHMPREIACRRPGLTTKVGLGTFVDPRIEGGKLNDISTEDLVEVTTIDGEDWLRYKLPRPNVAMIRGSFADEHGNISLDREGVILEVLSVAQAAKACGGIVIAQVEHVVKAGTLHPRAVKVPGITVDYVVVAKPEHHLQTMGTYFNPAYAGDIKVVTRSLPRLPLDPRKVVARRAAMELKPGAVANLGIGMPEGVGAVAAEENVGHLLTLTVETGPVGGIPASGLDFGHATNAEAVIDQASQFDFYDGGNLDIACLGLAQTDPAGNVNVSKFSGRPVGCGGFINITQSAKAIVFCGTFTAGGLEVEIGGGRLRIVTEGKSRKFQTAVEQITFSGAYANSVGQKVLYVTERAVFRLTSRGLELIEIAPGVDLQRDILDQMDFAPIVEAPLPMPAALFEEEWGGLAAHIARGR